MSVHSGHRERMRERFLTEGLDQFTDIQVLELLLFYCIPQLDTNPIAHALLDHFGSISGVMDAPIEELCKIKGVGKNTAVYLKMIPQAGRFYLNDKVSSVEVLPTLESCAAYLQPCFFGRKTEMAFLLCLDAKCKVLCCRKIAEGNVSSTGISVRKIMEIAINANATSVVLAHNHPGGLAIPSAEDHAATRQVAAALNAVDIQLIDHVVVADDDYVSMKQSGYSF